MQTLPISRQTADALRDAYSNEVVAVSTYNQMSALQSAMGYKKLAAKFAEEAAEEMGHARQVAERLAVCGEAVSEPTSIEPFEGNIIDMFRRSLKIEESAVLSYQNVMDAAESDSDYGAFELALQILKSSEEHYIWLAQQLSLIEEIGLPDYLAMWV